MSANLQFGKVAVAAALDLLLADINDGGQGRVDIYDGSMPANLAAAETGTLLASCELTATAAPAYGSTDTTTLVATGSTSGSFAEDASANATGTAGYFRMYSFSGAKVFQGECSGPGGGGACVLSTTSIVSGSPVTITSSTITMSGLT